MERALSAVREVTALDTDATGVRESAVSGVPVVGSALPDRAGRTGIVGRSALARQLQSGLA